MRTICFYAEKPKASEVIVIGKRASVFIRQNIEKVTEEVDGETKEYWKAIEYSTQVNALNFKADKTFVDTLIEAETEKAAEEVRAKRNYLLDKTDKEMTVDRIEQEPEEVVEAWKAYRQALRDIPEQEGFPFDVEWPERP